MSVDLTPITEALRLLQSGAVLAESAGRRDLAERMRQAQRDGAAAAAALLAPPATEPITLCQADLLMIAELLDPRSVLCWSAPDRICGQWAERLRCLAVGSAAPEAVYPTAVELWLSPILHRAANARKAR